MESIKTLRIIIFSLFCIGTTPCKSTPLPEGNLVLQSKEKHQKLPDTFSYKKRIYKTAKIITCASLSLTAAATGSGLAYTTKNIINWVNSGYIPIVVIKFFPNIKYIPWITGASSAFSFCASWYFFQKTYYNRKNAINM